MMHFLAPLGLAFALSLGTVRAQNVEATLYTDNDCTGDATVISIDVSDSHCFAIGGNSFGNLYYGDIPVAQAWLVTWSGSNCEGSSAVWTADAYSNDGCQNVPYAGAELIADYNGPEVPAGNGTESSKKRIRMEGRMRRGREE